LENQRLIQKKSSQKLWNQNLKPRRNVSDYFENDNQVQQSAQQSIQSECLLLSNEIETPHQKQIMNANRHFPPCTKTDIIQKKGYGALSSREQHSNGYTVRIFAFVKISIILVIHYNND